MRQEHRRSFIRNDTGAELVFDDSFVVDGELSEETLTHHIPQGTTEGADGEYQGPTTLEPRLITYQGLLLADDLTELQDMEDELFAGLPKGTTGRIVYQIVDLDTATVLRSRYLKCVVSARGLGKYAGLPHRPWTVTFRSGDPAWYDSDYSPGAGPLTLNVAGSANVIAVGGTEAALPVFALTVSHTGKIQIKIGGVLQMEITAAATGAYVIDAEARVLTRGGVNMLGEITAGGWFEIPVATSLTFTYASSGAVSAGTVKWRKRYASAI